MRRLSRAGFSGSLPLAVALALSAPPTEAAARSRPVVVVSYFEVQHQARLVDALRRSAMPGDVPIYYGSYYGSLSPPGKPRRRPPPPEVPGGRFAPIFPVRPSTFWLKRALRPHEQRIVAARGDAGPRGRIPRMGKVLRGSFAYPSFRWGVEVGRRFRDRIRLRRRKGIPIETWQFDEVLSQVAGRGPHGGRARRIRQYTRGLLQGLTYGRPALGDEELPGIVFMAHRAFALARRPSHGLKRFWRTLDRASLRLVGEEYPPFSGSPRRAAYRQSSGQRLLRRAGGPRASLASKYVVGMSPGYRHRAALGGNLKRRPRRAVNAWRRAFIRARAGLGASGFAEFNFRGRNGRRRVWEDVIAALAGGVRRLGGG